MKKIVKIMAMTLIVSSLMSMTAFATPAVSTDTESKPVLEETLKARIETLRAEGMTKAEIGAVLKEEGFKLRQRPNHPILDEALKARIEELRAEGMTKVQIGAVLKEEGFKLRQRPNHPKALERMTNTQKSKNL